MPVFSTLDACSLLLSVDFHSSSPYRHLISSNSLCLSSQQPSGGNKTCKDGPQARHSGGILKNPYHTNQVLGPQVDVIRNNLQRTDGDASIEEGKPFLAGAVHKRLSPHCETGVITLPFH